jgi:hypothetical protein
MSTEDAMFAMADALLGVMSEHGSIDRYMDDKVFIECMVACKKLNSKRYVKDIIIYL